MTPVHKTLGIVSLAAAVAGAAALFTAARSASPPLLPITQSSSRFKVEANMASSYVLLGNSEAHMAVTVTAPNMDRGKRRPPVNLSIVLDRSGSMNGDKLENAKRAADKLLGQLSPEDRFSIVAYGSDVDLIYPSAQASAAEIAAGQRAIMGIYDDGGTNLSGGLDQGRAQILSHRGNDSISRIVLISDGIANEGVTGEHALARLAEETAAQGISITTVGVGVDFDEKVMTRMAVAGRGNYYFVEDAGALAEMFGNELGRLGETVATNVLLKLRPAPGVEILEAYGHTLARTGNLDIFLPIADLRSGETRKVVLKLRMHTNDVGEMDVAAVDVDLLPTYQSNSETIQARAHVAVTSSRKLVDEHLDRETVEHIERARTSHALAEATEMWENGKAEQAQLLMARRRSEAQQAAKQVKSNRLDDELSRVTSGAEGTFGTAYQPSISGKRAKKSLRKGALDLAF